MRVLLKYHLKEFNLNVAKIFSGSTAQTIPTFSSHARGCGEKASLSHHRTAPPNQKAPFPLFTFPESFYSLEKSQLDLTKLFSFYPLNFVNIHPPWQKQDPRFPPSTNAR